MLLDECILLNYSESDVGGDMLSAIGYDMDLVAPYSFAAAAAGFNNAVKLEAGTSMAKTQTIIDSNYNTNKGMFIQRVYLDSWSIVNGVRTGISGARTFWEAVATDPSYSIRGILPQGGGAGWYFSIGDIGVSVLSWLITTGFNVSANTWTTLIWVWDRDHATKNLRLIIIPDGGGPTELTTSGTWTNYDMTSDNVKLALGNNRSGVPGLGIPGMMDHQQWYKDSSQDYIDDAVANAGNPTFIPPVPDNIDASDGTYSDKVKVIFDDGTVGYSTPVKYNLYRSSTAGGVYSKIVEGAVIRDIDDFTAPPNIDSYFKVSSVNVLDEESDLSVYDSGYPYIKIIVPLYTNKSPKVIILGIDVWKLGYISSVPRIVEYKTFRRDKIFSNRITLSGINYDDFFSVNNSKSIFSNIKWQYGEILILDKDNNLIWDGLIEDIIRNHNDKTFELDTVDDLYKIRSKKVIYETSGYETPAEAFQNVCELIGFTKYSKSSVIASDRIYKDNNCYIKCKIRKSDEITFQQFIEKLSEVGCADTFSNKGILNYKHWTEYTAGSKIRVTNKDLRRRPKMYGLEKDIVNDYSITYESSNGVPVTDATGDNIGSKSRNIFDDHPLPDMDCDEENQIVLKDLVSAKYIGSCYIRMTHKTNTLDTNPKIREGVSIEFGTIRSDWFDLNTVFALDIEDEDLYGHVIDTFKTDLDIKTDNLILEGVEV